MAPAYHQGTQHAHPRELVLEPVGEGSACAHIEAEEDKAPSLLSCCTFPKPEFFRLAFASTMLTGGGACMTEAARAVNLTTPWMLAKSG